MYLHLGSFAVKGGDSIDTISAGAPDIQGQFGTGDGTAWLYSPATEGAFINHSSPYASQMGSNSSTTDRTGYIRFAASNYSSVYGNANTVQPPALQLIPQIRY